MHVVTPISHLKAIRYICSMMNAYRFLYFVFALFALPFACSKDNALFQVENLNGNTISAFGHAGMGIAFMYPINSYESIEPCLRIGADGTEMDIQMTKDSVLIVFHDRDLNEGSLCSGVINDKFWSEIWGCHHANPYSHQVKILSFRGMMDDLLAAGYDIQKYVFTLDIKLYTNTLNYYAYLDQFANAIIREADDYSLADNIMIESADTMFLRMLQQKRSDLKLMLYTFDFEKGLSAAQVMNLHGITTHLDKITTEQMRTAHDDGLRVALWGIKTNEDDLRAIEKSPDYIQSDKIIHLLKLFGKYKE